MKTIRFIKDPGYTYDLFFLFILYFNTDYCLTHLVNYNQSAEDTAFFTQVLRDYEEIPDDFLLFFFLKDNGKCFMTDCYFDPYSEDFTTTYSLSRVQMALTVHEQVKANLIRYYFTETDESAVEECRNSIAAVGQLIKDSSYSDSVKSALYAFFINPLPVLQKLSLQLMTMEISLAKQYSEKNKKLSLLEQQFDLETVSEQLKLCRNESCHLDDFDSIYVSACFINKNCIKTIYLADKAVLLLGLDYKASLEYCISAVKIPRLDVLGNVIADAKRLEILDLIDCKSEVTIWDVERELGITGTDACQHLTAMLRANMLKTRNQGRTVLYRINKGYFSAVCTMLNQYAD